MLIDFKSQSVSGTYDVEKMSLCIDQQILKFLPRWQKPIGRLYLIFSTECNLRCTYCFQNGLARIGASLDKARVHQLIRSLQNEIQEIVLFGGEPLLQSNFELITSIFAEFDYLRILVFSNGNFDPCYRDLLLDYAYAIGGITISLDGPAHIHNKRRINPTKDSYATIIENLSALKKLGSKINISINVDTTNIGSIQQLIEETYIQLSFTDFVYMLNPVKYTPTEVPLEDLLTLYCSLRSICGNKLYLNNRLTHNLEQLFKNRPLQQARCNLATTYVLSFPDDSVYACPQNACSTIGTISGETLNIDKRSIEPAIEETSFETPKCRSCSYNYLCPFNCPFVPPQNDCQKVVNKLLGMALSNIEFFCDEELLNRYKIP